MKKDNVLNYVDSNYVLSLTEQLICIPSESGSHERSKDRTALVHLLDQQFKALGLDTSPFKVTLLTFSTFNKFSR